MDNASEGEPVKVLAGDVRDVCRANEVAFSMPNGTTKYSVIEMAQSELLEILHPAAKSSGASGKASSGASTDKKGSDK